MNQGNSNITSIKEDNKYLLEVNVEGNLGSSFDGALTNSGKKVRR
jgi:hypothetical protein